MKTINLSKILRNYSSGWVAVTPDYKDIVASGRTLKEITFKVKRIGRYDAVLISVAKNYRGFVTGSV